MLHIQRHKSFLQGKRATSCCLVLSLRGLSGETLIFPWLQFYYFLTNIPCCSSSCTIHLLTRAFVLIKLYIHRTTFKISLSLCCDSTPLWLRLYIPYQWVCMKIWWSVHHRSLKWMHCLSCGIFFISTVSFITVNAISSCHLLSDLKLVMENVGYFITRVLFPDKLM